MQTSKNIAWQYKGAIAHVRLSRAEKRNALSHDMRAELIRVFLELAGQAKVVVLDSSSDVFCAGIDLKERIEGVDPAVEMWEMLQAIYAFPGVVIAKVDGLALGGGVSLIDACDLAVASDRATFGLPEIGFGIYPAIAGPLTQLTIPKKHAAWMVLTGERVAAAQALEMGLINRVVPVGELEQSCNSLAEKISSFDPNALQITKNQLNSLPVNATTRDQAVRNGIASNKEQLERL